MNHPYYESTKRLNSQNNSLRWILFAMVAALLLCAYGIFSSVKWEINNMVEVWVEYEAIVHENKVILYKSHDVEDSIVFRMPGTVNPFEGIQSIEKLEYRLP